MAVILPFSHEPKLDNHTDLKPLPSTIHGGGGTYDGMEPRVAKLEAHVEHIQSDIREMKDGVAGLRSDARNDFRILFGALIAVALGLAGLMAKGFHWL